LSPILFNLYSEYLIKEGLEGFWRLKNRRTNTWHCQILGTVKYADYFVILAEEKTVLQGMIVRLIEIGRCCGVEINVAKILR